MVGNYNNLSLKNKPLLYIKVDDIIIYKGGIYVL